MVQPDDFSTHPPTCVSVAMVMFVRDCLPVPVKDRYGDCEEEEEEEESSPDSDDDEESEVVSRTVLQTPPPLHNSLERRQNQSRIPGGSQAQRLRFKKTAFSGF